MKRQAIARRAISTFLAAIAVCALLPHGTAYAWPWGKKEDDRAAAEAHVVTGATLDDVHLSLNVSAPGTAGEYCENAAIDYSNASDGYVMACFTAPVTNKIKVQLVGPQNDTYTYTLTPQVWAAFPLSEGSGEYTLSIFYEVAGGRYAMILSAVFDAQLKDEFAPFLRPNQYVNYAYAPNTVLTAEAIVTGIDDTLEKVKAVYDFVIGHLTYDNELAATVESGYVPDLDADLASGKGICFDYASMMAGMLRSVGVPSKLVLGYAGTVYHAWLSVFVEGTGWVDNVVYFDGVDWQRMDPTFADAEDKKAAARYIGDGTNYISKFFY